MYTFTQLIEKMKNIIPELKKENSLLTEMCFQQKKNIFFVSWFL